MRIQEIQLQATSDLDLSEFDKGIIKNVKFTGLKSKNGHTYKEQGLRKAIETDKIYEGLNVYVNHNKKKVAEDHFGRLTETRFVSGDGGRGTLHFLTSHPMAPRVKEDLQRNLAFFGLSHVIEASGNKNKSGGVDVESIERADSVDLVTSPATVQSLREQFVSEAEGDLMPHEQQVLDIIRDASIDMDTKIANITSVLTQAAAAMLAGQEPGDMSGTEGEGAVGGNGEAAPEPPKPTQEQVEALAAKVSQLTEQLNKLSQNKYIKPKTGPAGGKVLVKEQSMAAETDLKKVGEWFRN